MTVEALIRTLKPYVERPDVQRGKDGCRERRGPLDWVRVLEVCVKGSGESASALIDARIRELGDWRGEMLARVRAVVLGADAEMVEEWKWRGVPVWSRGGIVCTGETYKNVVKLTFAKGAALADPAGLFNSSLEGNVRRAIDIREGEVVDEGALRELVRAAVEANLAGGAKAERVR